MNKGLDYKSLWNDVLSQVKSKIGDQTFGLWFASLSFDSASEDEIIVKAPSDFHRDKIISKYSGYIEPVINELYGKPVKVIIKVESPANNKISSASVKLEQKPEKIQSNIISSDSDNENKNQKKETNSGLIKTFTFENYVVGDNNEFAVKAASAVAKNPGVSSSYNPLFIYGGVGLGKTHLIQAIGNYISENLDKKVIYTTAEAFTNEFIDTIGNKSMPLFRKKYRNADVLIIDDIHFLENKSGSQEELFNTFNALISDKRQMVFTSDRPTSELKNYEERLTTRLRGGVQVDIQIPLYETRCAILKQKIDEFKLSIPDEVIELICKNISTNIRDIVGAFNIIKNYSELINKKITLEIAQEQLKDIFTSPKNSNVSIDTIQHIVADYFSLSINDIKGKKRIKNIVYSRQLAMYVASKITEFSTTEIGQSFGGRDHTTVLHSLKVIEEKLKNDPAEDGRVQKLIRLVKEYSVK